MKKVYLGIDLGTTNSSIAWSMENEKGEIQTKVLDVIMQEKGGGLTKNSLLPSVVYFDDKNTANVGKYAKSMIGLRTSRVIKSVKNHMGKQTNFNIGENNYTPAEISSLILKHLSNNVEKVFGKKINDVIVTVPASFDTDMREATLEAIEKAGFNIKDENGNLKEILLSEPRAALFDYVNLQNKGEIPFLIDFHTPKNVLVFDLGGGTLDVSIHKLQYTENKVIDIKDLGISRYTKVGGDNFDELLANRFLDEFKRKIEWDKLRDFEKEWLPARFLEIAEEAKIEINNEIENRKMLGISETDDIEIEILKSNIIDNRIFDYLLTLDEYKKIVSGLMGNNLTLDMVKNLDSINNTENIVYPILDALSKANQKESDLVKIDAVLLNGGMTKFHLIQERLEKLFGFMPLSVLDQDKSVARGASVYHYKVANGYSFEKIQNDTIGLEIDGENVVHLLQAGTILPCSVDINRDFTIPVETNFITLPLYLGRRNDTKEPNRKISEKNVFFNSTLQKGDKVRFKLNVNNSGLISIDAYSNGEIVSAEFDERDGAQKIIRKEQTKQNFVPTGNIVEINKTFNTYVSLCQKMTNAKETHKKASYMESVKKIEKEILNAQNGLEITKYLLENFQKFNFIAKERTVLLLGILGQRYSEISNEIGKILTSLIDALVLNLKSPSEINSYYRYIVEAIRKVNYKPAETKISDLLHVDNCIGIRSSILMTLGSIGDSINTLKYLESFALNGRNNSEKMSAYWGLGKMASREKSNPPKVVLFEKLLKTTLKQLKGYNSHIDLEKYSIYFLTELCDRRFNEVDCISDTYVEAINTVVNSLNVKTANKSILELLGAVVNGQILDENQQRVLGLAPEFPKFFPKFPSKLL